MNKRPTPKNSILQIENYVPGRKKAGKGIRSIKLSANESPIGVSKKAVKAYKKMANNLASYPDGSAKKLRKILAKINNIETDNIVIGAGSDELLHLLAQIYLTEKDQAIMNEFGFLLYPIITKGIGAEIKFAKAKDYRANIDNILAQVNERTKIIFLDNPNNPSGTYLNKEELERLHAGLRPDILLIIDSAYAEYVSAKDYEAGIELVRKSENVVMVRTFSKIGLAALRLGWLYAPSHIVEVLNKFRTPFNVNMAAQAAGIATLKDKNFMQKLVAHNKKWRNWLTKELNSNKLRVLPSETNFVLVLFAEQDGLSAKRAEEKLLKNGLVVRNVENYGLPNALRISISSEEAMLKTAKVLKEFAENDDV